MQNQGNITWVTDKQANNTLSFQYHTGIKSRNVFSDKNTHFLDLIVKCIEEEIEHEKRHPVPEDTNTGENRQWLLHHHN